MQQQGTEGGRAVLGQRVACWDGQRRVWRAIDLLRQAERAAKGVSPVGRAAARPPATDLGARRAASGT